MHHPTATLPRTVAALRGDIVGIDTDVPLLDGTTRRYVFLDNAASTPALKSVLQAVNDFMPWYSGVHRGTGFKSLLATEAFDAAHDVVGRFVGADLRSNTVIFTKNTTECMNKIAVRFGFRQGDVVLTTLVEHHSNDLPWRRHATVKHVGITPEGRVRLDELRDAIAAHRGRLRAVAVHGASNITGLCPPIHRIARWAHEAGARIVVDAAQLAPHRAIDMRPDDDPEHLDFVVLSAHKMYAPFGTGALIGPRAFFAEGDPDMVGGGVVDVVTLDEAHWNQPPHKEEAGSPNVIGGIALAAAAQVLSAVGMDAVARHELELLRYAYGRLGRMRGIRLYGPTDALEEKVGVITFNIEGVHHALAAAIMGAEGGIGVRNGCFCAHPYVKELLGLTPEEDRVLTAEVLAGDKSRLPGMVRASLGCYSDTGDIDAFIDMAERIARRDYRGTYVQDRASGSYRAEGYAPDFRQYFHFAPPSREAHHRLPSEAS
jgi:selenocysteine lyase/cysteine desulfurase